MPGVGGVAPLRPGVGGVEPLRPGVGGVEPLATTGLALAEFNGVFLEEFTMGLALAEDIGGVSDNCLKLVLGVMSLKGGVVLFLPNKLLSLLIVDPIE